MSQLDFNAEVQRFDRSLSKMRLRLLRNFTQLALASLLIFMIPQQAEVKAGVQVLINSTESNSVDTSFDLRGEDHPRTEPLPAALIDTISRLRQDNLRLADTVARQRKRARKIVTPCINDIEKLKTSLMQAGFSAAAASAEVHSLEHGVTSVLPSFVDEMKMQGASRGAISQNLLANDQRLPANVLFIAPDTMRVSESQTVSLIVVFGGLPPSDGNNNRMKGSESTQAVPNKPVEYTPYMSAALSGEGFSCHGDSIVQLLRADRPTKWIWSVTPQIIGERDLILTVFAHTTKALPGVAQPIYTQRIHVMAEPYAFLRHNWQALMASIVIPLLGIVGKLGIDLSRERKKNKKGAAKSEVNGRDVEDI